MTKKQFEWLREHQPIEVSWFRPYEGKEPKGYHLLHPCQIGMEIRGEYIIFSGNYHTYDNGTWHQHYARYKLHYKNIRQISYIIRT